MTPVRVEWALAVAAAVATALFVARPLAAQSRAGRTGQREAPRVLALGDSYTIGEKVDSAERWPVQLVRMLRARQVSVADPQIVARTGWTTDELAAGISVAAPTGPFALVTLLIGVNNQYRGRDADRYRAEFVSLLSQAVGFAGGRAERVIVLSIPDWGVTPFAAGRDRAKIAAEIDRFNAIGREESRRAGAAWVDVTPASREAHEGWTTADGLHPSARQYARWAELALEPAVIALRAR